MKIYYKKEQFPEIEQWCNPNPRGLLHHDIQYISADENKIVVGDSESEQEDFDVFWDEIDNFINYITDVLLANADHFYLSYLEEFDLDNVEETLLMNEFKIEGVEWLTNRQ